MKTHTPNPATVQPEEALTLAAWVEAHAQSECDDDYDDWVAKCTRIAAALRQLAALQNTLKSELVGLIENLKTLDSVDGPAVLLNRELASINNQSTPRHANPFDKDEVYSCGPRPIDTK